MNAKPEISEYQQQAIDFCKKYKVNFKAEFDSHAKYFDHDKESRDIYQITLTRENKKPYTFRFGQSIANSRKQISLKFRNNWTRKEWSEPKLLATKSLCAPTSYDVLATITKNYPGTFDEFCSDFGYSNDSIKAHKTYNAVMAEWLNVERLFNTEELIELQEIA